jgi:hypothetical protein
VYYNGVSQPLQTVNSWSGVISYPSSDWFAIGQEVNENRPFTGLIDEVQVYNTALSAAQVQAIYNAGSAGMYAAQTASTTTVSSSASPAQVGDPVTFTASVSPSSATGTITFMDNGTSLGTKTLSGGQATFTTSALALGVHRISALYSGDATYSGSVSPAINQIENLDGAKCAPQPAGLLDWYPAEGNTNDTIGGNNGIVEGSVSYAPGVVGQAFSFAGSGDVALSLPSLNTAWGTQVTVSFWMNWSGNDNEMPFGFTSYDLWLNSGHFGFNTGNGDIWGISSSGLANTWTYVTAVFSNGDPHENQIYINGVLQTLSQQFGSTSSSAQVATQAKIGSWNNNSNYLFNGLIDEVQIFNGALTAAEIQSIYQAGAAGVCAVETPTTTTVSSSQNPANVGASLTFTATVSPSAATGSVTFMDGGTTLGTSPVSGGQATLPTSALAFGSHSITAVYSGDTSYSGSNSAPLVQQITISGTACAPQLSGLVSWWRGEGNGNDQLGLNNLTLYNSAGYAPGFVGQAFDFPSYNGSSSGYARNSNTQVIPASGPIGFAAWINYNSSNAAGVNPEVLTLDGPSACGNGVLHGIVLVGKTTVAIARGCGGSPNFNCGANVNLGDNNWHFVVTGWDGSNATVYVDGSLAAQCTGNDFTRDASWVSIGGRPDQDSGSSPYVGLADEVQVYNRALTASEVQGIFAAGALGTCVQ